MNKVLFFLLIALIYVSCTTGSPRNRGSLSDAMDKSRDDYEDERTVPDEQDEWYYDAPEEEPEYEDSEEGAPDYYYSSYPTEAQDVFILLRGGASLVSDPYFDNPLDGEVLIGSSSEGNFGFFLFAGFKALTVQKDDDIYESIENKPFILHCGLETRFYPLKDWTLFSPYLTGRVSAFVLAWSYKNALIAGDDTIYTDFLSGFGFDAGAGVDLIQTEQFRAGVLLLPQGFLFGVETAEGFNNDVFDAYGTVRWSAEAGFRI